MASNVNLIDPNEINTKLVGNDIVNAIPQYQDMYIFAELTAKSRARTVIITSNDGSISQGTMKTGLKPQDVNFIGVNQNSDENDSNYLKFTTNYYDGSTGTRTQYESFGISHIKVVVNSSFIPQVNIQFVDLRGLSFFNQEDSPYRILFDFPPPIFELSLKGYYGKTLKYLLHLVKYTSEFQSESGNFVIDAQFVAITYAPLTDIPFRYIVNSALITNPQVSISPLTDKRPANTAMLITQLKNLYTSVIDKVKTDNDSKEYDRAKLRSSEVDNIVAMLQAFKVNPDLSSLGTPRLVTKNIPPSSWSMVDYTDNTDDENQEISELSILSEYDLKIKALSTDGVPEKMDDRLYIVLPVNYNSNNMANPQYFGKVENVFETYRKKLIENTASALGIRNVTLEPSISKANFDNYYNLERGVKLEYTTKYIGIDVTDFYLILYREKSESKKRIASLSETLIEKINELVINNLGMSPTIYNIFQIILNDVDKFFEQLRKVSIDAENAHHNDATNKRIILGGSYKDKIPKENEKIYAFPLIVDTEKIICGGNKEEKIAPIELSKKTLTPFPEMLYVDEFIKTFFSQARLNYLENMRENQNDDGTFEWIPITPLDSKLGTIDASSPYYKIDALNLSEKNKMGQVLEILLKRFYVLSQYSIPDNFYTDKNKITEYAKMYAESEALNLALSVANSDYTDSVKTFADKYKDANIDEFYKELDAQVPDWYGFPDNSVSKIEDVIGDESVFVNKNDSNFLGLNLYYDGLVRQTINESSERPIDKFKNGVRRSGFAEFFLGREKEVYYQFTNENTLYVVDKKIDKSGNDKDSNVIVGNENIITRYLTEYNHFNSNSYSTTVSSSNLDYTKLISSGNTLLGKIYSKTNSLKKFENVVDLWSEQLSNEIDVGDNTKDFDDLIYGDIIKTTSKSKLSALFILSNFGNVLSPFNVSPNNLNSLIFTTPAAIEVPKYLPLYLGALIDANEDEEHWIDDVVEYFTEGNGKYIYDKSYLIFCDYSDVNKYLSVRDKATLRGAFLDYYNNGNSAGEYHQSIVNLEKLYLAVSGSAESNKEKAYRNYLDPEENKSDVTKYYEPLLKPLIERLNMIVFSQNTFKMSTNNPVAFQSIKSVKDGSDVIKKTVNEGFFKKFLTILSSQIDSKKNEAIKKEIEDNKKKCDRDIITQTYYSFKNINDKWLTGPTKSNISGYPFNRDGKNLIDSFVFVDRAMNPAGDTMLNAEILIELFDDPNISVYSVLSQLLSLNGFEFFPLQNFMVGTKEWVESFKIDTSGNIDDRAAFVCMYIGGTSNYPTSIQNNFMNDGIEDLSNTDATDFSIGEPCPPNDTMDNQVAKNGDFPYNNVNAFRVRFGEQNQSMFTGIKIDSKEYPETNESIQILSRLAGDNKEHAIPKGQNLYNLYENRSYKATVTGLGNMMIQPTQYFQLENVPLFNGAYIILSVEHDITPNKMTTSFSGTKILKYPVPRVTEPLAFMGYDGGESTVTNIKELSEGDLVAAASVVDNEQKAQFNSMYNFKIE